MGTIFDDNATRNIFDSSLTGTNGNSAAGSGYIGFFRPEGSNATDTIPILDASFPFISPTTHVQPIANTLANLVKYEAGDFNVLPIVDNNGTPTGTFYTLPPSQQRSLDVNGPWTIAVTNFTATAPAAGHLYEFSLQFSTGMSASSPTQIDQTLVTGALGNTFALKPPSAPSTGVGPGLVLAMDNTLGPDSPFQGRIYAAYVVYFKNTDPNGHVNPTSNTDIALSYSDNGGRTWVYAGLVNDDAATLDGYSGSSINSASLYTSGRTQFQPEVAVDQATGTLVVTWRDARNDAANARVATYITTSIDGGNTFSAQTYANPSQTAIDAITGQTDVMGPMADNQSSGDAQADASFGYGNQMGLAVFDGQVYPIWAGNFNAAFLNNGTITAYPLNIWYRPMVIAAGPRIISSSMGPIPLAEAASGSVSVSVTFDRPVDPATFVPGDVQAFFHDTTNGSPSVPLTVTGVNTATTNFTGTVTSGSRFVTFVSSTTGLFYKETITGIGIPAGTTIQNIDSANDTITLSSAATVSNTENLAGIGSSTYGYTQFTITFNPTPAGANPATYNYTGTYSYLIALDNGAGIAISSPIGAYIGTTPRTADPMDQNADGTSDQNAVTTPFVGTTPGDVYAVPTPQPTTAMQFF